MITRHEDGRVNGRVHRTIVIINIDTDRLIDLLAGVAFWVLASIALATFIGALFDGAERPGMPGYAAPADPPEFSYETHCRSTDTPRSCLPAP